MKKTNLLRGLALKHKWGLGMIIVLLILSSVAVKYFKRPGQMSVIEAQAMDMTAMKPPVGAVPVATQIVSRGPFGAKVRYTGSVVAYTEQNIYPRVEGWLTGLKVYNGDSVRAGQLLAVLDSPDIQSRLSEATYGHSAAVQEIPVAQSNLAQMKAEKRAAQGEIESAKARLNAVQQTVSQMQTDLKSAQANLDYWKAEIKREGNLLKAGAVSQQEFDAEKAQMIAAQAEVENKQSRIEEARANVMAAKADVSVARDRASAADAALSAASGEVTQKVANAGMAGAARATAATFNQYRQIRAPFDGVVTKRFVSPGVLVNPGTAILNIVQIDKVRLQANVAEQDLGTITIGAPVKASTIKEPKRTFQAYVSSISPAADPVSRTAIVEAVIENPGHYLVPGDFLSMEITTSQATDAITVPVTALATKDGQPAVWITDSVKGTGKTIYYCTMHPEVTSDKPGICPKCKMDLEPKEIGSGKKAHLVAVTTGKSDGQRTEILAGLNDGDEVIRAGNRYLKEGDFVTQTEWGENGPKALPPAPGEAADMKMPGMGGSNKSMPGMDM